MTTPKTPREKRSARSSEPSTPRPRLARPAPSAHRTARVPADPFEAAIDVFARAIAARVVALQAEGLGGVESSAGYDTQDDCPIPQRRYLDLVRDGDLVARKIGKCVLVRRSDLHAWIESHPEREPLEREGREPKGASRAPARPAAAPPRPETDQERIDRQIAQNGYGARAPKTPSPPKGT